MFRSVVVATTRRLLVEKLNQVQVCCGGNHEKVLGGETKLDSGLLWWQLRGSSWWGEQSRSRFAVVATTRQFLVEKPNQVQVWCGGNYEEVLGGETKLGSGLLWWQP